MQNINKDEAKWQAAEAIDRAFEGSEEVDTRCDEFNAPDIHTHSLLESNIQNWEAQQRRDQRLQQMKERNAKPVDWTDPSILLEEVDFQWEELFGDDVELA